jgi:hypothetical protein
MRILLGLRWWGAVGFATASVAMASCSSDECGLKVTQQGPSAVEVTQDAKVSVAFQVVDCNGKALATRLQLTNDKSSNFDLREDGATISSESMKSVTPRPQVFKTSSVLLLDVSDSIHGSLPDVAAAAGAFVDQLFVQEGHGEAVGTGQLAVYTFDGREHVQELVAFTSDPGAARIKLDAISTVEKCKQNGFCQDPATNLHGAILDGLQRLAEARATVEASGVRISAESLVVFTDGRDTAQWIATDRVEAALRADKSRAFFVGLKGADLDEARLKRLGGDNVVLANNVAGLAASFTEIGTEVTRLAHSYYFLEYCSPIRFGTDHSLSIVASDGRLTGSLTVKFGISAYSGMPCALTP